MNRLVGIVGSVAALHETSPRLRWKRSQDNDTMLIAEAVRPDVCRPEPPLLDDWMAVRVRGLTARWPCFSN